MIGFGLLLGHLVGDYVVQNDWLARWKAAKAGDLSEDEVEALQGRISATDHLMLLDWADARPMVACFLHCLLYSLAVWAFACWWMPWWGPLAVFAAHFPVDRWRLAGRWMRHVSGQRAFADGPLAPWSVVVVDNTFHLLVLFAVAAAAGRLT